MKGSVFRMDDGSFLQGYSENVALEMKYSNAGNERIVDYDL